MPGRGDEADQTAKPAEHVSRIDFLDQLVGCLDPVLQRDYQRVGTDHRFYGFRRRRHLPGLDATQDIVDHADFGGIIGDFDPIENEITGNAADLLLPLTSLRH